MTADLLERLAAHERNISPAPWDVAAMTHAEKLAALEAEWRDLEKQSNAALAVARDARGQLRDLESALADVDLDNLGEWANEFSRLSNLANAATDKARILGTRAEATRRKHRAASVENPAAAVKAERIRYLRAVMASDDATNKERNAAYKELKEIEDADRPRVIEKAPPGFDPRRYDEKGNLIR